MRRLFFFILVMTAASYCHGDDTVNGMLTKEDRDMWIDRYLSVCYPVKEVRVTSPYGHRKDPFTNKVTLHSGLDLAASFEEVYSMFDGIVVRTGSDGRSGSFVMVRYGDYTVSYCHLSRVLVKDSMEVFAGDVLAFSGNSGRSTGPHLHLTARKGSESYNPSLLLRYIRDVREEALEALACDMSLETPVFVDVEKKDTMIPNTGNFFRRYARIAQEHQRRYGIPASVTLSQMAYESGFGRSKLARKSNNYFGIKAYRQWLLDGRPYSLHTDDKPNEKFCVYGSAEESMEHHARQLMSSRYRRCHKYAPTDYHRWLVGIKAAGYATCSSYAERCEAIIRKYKLYLYDRL
jgi:hypothetical protein